MIRIEDLHFAWPDGRQVFAGLSLVLPRASVTALVGPNGTGKTTLLRLVTGLEKPERGRIEIVGKDAGAGPERMRWIGAVMQNADRHVLCDTVLDEVATTPRLLGLRDPRGLAQQTLERLGLGALAPRHPLDLDTSARRLAAFVAAVAHQPQILLLDEAQRGFDRLYRNRLQAAILAEAARGATVLLVSQDAGFIRRTVGRVIDMTAESGLREQDV